MEHVALLKEAGYLEATLKESNSSNSRYMICNVKGLTWAGHQFIANAKNQTIWNRTVQTIKDKGASVSMEILTAIMTQKAKELFGVQ